MIKATNLILLILFIACVSCTHEQNSNSNLSNTKIEGAKNIATSLQIEKKSLNLKYDGTSILESKFNKKATITSNILGESVIKQDIHLTFSKDAVVKATVYGSSEALAAETRGSSQKNFPLVRTTHGLSNNLRNNAIYDRNSDWMLEFSEGVKIESYRSEDGTTRFELTFTGKTLDIVFRPLYYQKHKNLTHYKPWEYDVYKESITGWCSWWAFFRGFTEKDHQDLLDVWQKKRMRDYGYRFIQIDDVFQGGKDQGREICVLAHNYHGGRPTTWLDWKEDLFPNGMSGYVEATNKSGFSPAIWMGCFFSDEATVKEHPDWFVNNTDGNPAAADWVSYVMDATNPVVVEEMIRPTFKGLKEAGMEYVKIDQLRHYLYDNLHNNIEWCEKKGVSPDAVLRAYLKVAREELGDETFILSCWGVLPESIGLADACRIGGDGYGPVTMQQYNSWNGIVWRNDPDHCDVSPNKQAIDVGNVKDLDKRVAIDKESIIRPALASIAGAMLMLSDKPEIYEDDNRIFGLRRSSPVLFSVPGQLYDFDPEKTNWLKDNKRTDITTGSAPSPIDGDQHGAVCPFWVNEFNMDYENWNVLHRLNWVQGEDSELKPTTIKFADLGLDSSKEYIVFEFWSNNMLGVFKNEFAIDKLEAYGLESFSIREKLNHPQLVSTNRHLSQGAAEIESMSWENKVLQGKSKVIAEDEYVVTLFVPSTFEIESVFINGEEIVFKQSENILKLSYMPSETATVTWKVTFK